MVAKPKKSPLQDFNDAMKELQNAWKLWQEQQQDSEFVKANPKRNYWIRKASEMEAFAIFLTHGIKADPGAQLYLAIKRLKNGKLARLSFNGNPDDPCDLDEKESRDLWLKVAAVNF